MMDPSNYIQAYVRIGSLDNDPKSYSFTALPRVGDFLHLDDEQYEVKGAHWYEETGMYRGYPVIIEPTIVVHKIDPLTRN